MRLKLTREGYVKLQQEVQYLRTKKRKEVIQAIAKARELGDLRENAEYECAKREQQMLEKRIAELEATLSSVTILEDDQIDTTKAYLGTTVTIYDSINKKELRYVLVNKEEANLSEGKISIDSPVGKNLLGKTVGSEIEITIPAGTLRYKILNIGK
ncbi:MAG: transcription elongation factor GreA [Candidatus Omnitrophica bacterium]|nr:transcription elongation factor GreA [Candidatus Omnitrophota bacterium]